MMRINSQGWELCGWSGLLLCYWALVSVRARPDLQYLSAISCPHTRTEFIISFYMCSTHTVRFSGRAGTSHIEHAGSFPSPEEPLCSSMVTPRLLFSTMPLSYRHRIIVSDSPTSAKGQMYLPIPLQSSSIVVGGTMQIQAGPVRTERRNHFTPCG